MSEINNYLNELNNLKNLGLFDDDEQSSSEIDSLIETLNVLKTAENMQKKEYNSIDYKLDFKKDYSINIKYVNTSENENPTYAKEGDSGFDLRANESGVLKPLERKLISTGLYFELPENFDLEVKSRSGLAVKHGIGVLTGTVDTNYRGEVKVLLFNISNEEFTFEKGDRIAQAIVRPRVSTEYGKLIKVDSVEDLTQTNRGNNGFGSTGKQ